MWPFTKIRQLEQEIRDLKDELTIIAKENDKLSESLRVANSRPYFSQVAKDFDASHIGDALLSQARKELAPILKDKLLMAIGRMDYRDQRQRPRSPLASIAATDLGADVYQVEIQLPSLSCPFQVFGG